MILFQSVSPAAIYTLSLHDALPISLTVAAAAYLARLAALRLRQDKPAWTPGREALVGALAASARASRPGVQAGDRKSTRLNSSHSSISYAVFCLKKKNISS